MVLLQNGLERALLSMMPELHAFYIVRHCAEARGLAHHPLRGDEKELGFGIDEFLYEPWAGNTINLHSLSRDPFHAESPFPVGGTIRNVLPFPRSLSNSMRPSCASTTQRASGSPSLEPPKSLERALSIR